MNIPFIIDSKDICKELENLGVKTKTTFTADAKAYTDHISEVKKAIIELRDRIRNEIYDEVNTEFAPKFKKIDDDIKSTRAKNKHNSERIKALLTYKKTAIDPSADSNNDSNNSQIETPSTLSDMANAKNRIARMDDIVNDLTTADINSDGPPTGVDIDKAVKYYRSDRKNNFTRLKKLQTERKQLLLAKQKEYDSRFKEAFKKDVNKNSMAGLKKALRELTVFYPFPNALSEFIQTDYGQQVIGKNDIATLINALPKVKVHSYFITTPLLESLYNVYSWFDDGRKDGEALAKSGEKLGDVFKNFFEGITSKEGINDILPTLTKDIITGENLNQNDIAIKSLPEILYYKLYTTEHNNTYNIPCLLESDYYSSNGNYGWGKGNEYSGEPILAKVIKNASLNSFLSRSLGLSIMPMFNTAGGGAPGNTVIISFDLVNENLERAKANTEFVRSLVLSNKWIQVGLGQLPGNLYDVSIPGTGQRLFMCTADIRVQHKGALRSLRPESGPLPGAPASEETKCRIPDAYNVRITFESLLPDNVNQMLIAKDKDNQIFMNNRSVFPQLLDNAGKVLKNLTAAGKAKRQEKEASTEQPAGDASATEGGTPTTGTGDQPIENVEQAESEAAKTTTDTAAQQNPDNAEKIVEATKKSDQADNQSPSSPTPTTQVDCTTGIFNPMQYDNIELNVLQQYNPDIVFVEIPTEVPSDNPGEMKTITVFSVRYKPGVTKKVITIPASD